jgi:hypothetical protein
MTTNVGWNGVLSPGTVASNPAPAPADPALVQRFNEAMAPQSVASTPTAPSSADASPVDPTLATDRQLARLPPGQLVRLQAQWGDDDTGLRQHAKVMLDLIEKPIQQSIMKAIRKSFSKDDD